MFEVSVRGVRQSGQVARSVAGESHVPRPVPRTPATATPAAAPAAPRSTPGDVAKIASALKAYSDAALAAGIELESRQTEKIAKAAYGTAAELRLALAQAARNHADVDANIEAYLRLTTLAGRPVDENAVRRALRGA